MVMLYAQLKKVIEIDGRITQLHSELVHLYDERAKFVSTTPGKTSSAVTKGTFPISTSSETYDVWLQQTYAKLANAWNVYGIIIPDLAKLKPRLQNARKVLDSIQAVDQKLYKNMQILLVPPKKYILFPVDSSLRDKQGLIQNPDYINPALFKKHISPANTWRILVVLASDSGLNYGNAERIIKEKRYRLCGYDARALGVYEYASLTLQNNKIIDQNNWTILLNRVTNTEGALIASVKYVDSQYRFELDEANSTFGDERFRPAIEVKI